MPSPAAIDIDALVQPIPGDNPAGGPLPSEPTRQKLDDFREEFDPGELDESDPRRNDPTVEKKNANWQGVIDLGEETLKETSKSLLVAVRMTEALTMRHGMGGVRDGFRLMRRLTEEAWGRLIPPVEEPDDLEIRAGMFNWLDDPLRGALYPNKLRAVPMIHNGATPVSFVTCRGVGKKPPELDSAQVSNAARATDAEKCQNLVDDVTEALDEVNRLGNLLNEKMPEVAPSFYEVRKALEDCQTIAQWIKRENGGGGGLVGDGETVAGEAVAGGGGGGSVPAATTREGAYRQLEAAADALARVEPHSPVPYLVKRAVQLKDIKFPDLVEQLTKDANVLAFLKRDLTAPES
jgi:type VI secretion system protein ImpA